MWYLRRAALILGFFSATSGKLPFPPESLVLQRSSRYFARDILLRMNQSADPCENFYEFACGRYVSETEIPRDATQIDMFTSVGNEVLIQLKKSLGRPDFGVRAFRVAKDMYSGCMDAGLIEKRGAQPILLALSHLGGWPTLPSDTYRPWTNNTISALMHIISRLRQIGVSSKHILKCTIDIDIKDPSRRILILDSPDTIAHAGFLNNGWNDSLVLHYREYIVNASRALGVKEETADAIARDIITFEDQLAKVSLSKIGRRNPRSLYNAMTLWDLQQKYDFLDWRDLLKIIFPNIDIGWNQTISITDQKFFDSLRHILKDTPPDVILNYMCWRFIEETITYTTPKMKRFQMAYQIKFLGHREPLPRWKQCVLITLSEMPIVLSAMYVRDHFNNKAKDKAEDMLENIKDTFEAELKRTDWMDPVTKAAALEKLNHMTAFVGYPDELEDWARIDDLYKGTSCDPDEFFECILQNNVYLFNRGATLLNEPVNRTDWRFWASVVDVNAYYNPSQNTMRFPAGIFQGHFFDPMQPNYLNYGGIGLIMGHEITHGYDDLGSRFDSKGMLHNWWDKSTRDAYKARVQCIIEQYSNITDPTTGRNVNGENTQGENIADNGGVKISYQAYRRWVQERGREEDPINGLNFNPNQMFWITIAQTWCAKYRKETLNMALFSWKNAPGEYRALSTLRNSQDFAKDFQCPLGSSMNPTVKCQVW